MPDDLIDFTPDVRAKAQEIIKRYRVANTPFNPPMLGDVKDMLGAIVPATATNWPGGGLDPENGITSRQRATRSVCARSSRRRLVIPTSAMSPASQGGRSRRSGAPGTAARLMPASSTARTCRKARAGSGSPPPPLRSWAERDGLLISKPP